MAPTRALCSAFSCRTTCARGQGSAPFMTRRSSSVKADIAVQRHPLQARSWRKRLCRVHFTALSVSPCGGNSSVVVLTLAATRHARVLPTLSSTPSFSTTITFLARNERKPGSLVLLLVTYGQVSSLVDSLREFTMTWQCRLAAGGSRSYIRLAY